MKYVVEMGSGAMIYIPSFIKTSSGIIGGIHRHRKHGDLMRLPSFFQNKESTLKTFPITGFKEYVFR
jgi:hypothetical protein